MFSKNIRESSLIIFNFCSSVIFLHRFCVFFLIISMQYVRSLEQVLVILHRFCFSTFPNIFNAICLFIRASIGDGIQIALPIQTPSMKTMEVHLPHIHTESRKMQIQQDRIFYVDFRSFEFKLQTILEDSSQKNSLLFEETQEIIPI